MRRQTAMRLVAGTVAVIVVIALAQAVWSGTRGKTCADFDNQQEAQAYYAGLDPYGSHPMDADNDGEICEELVRRDPTSPEVAEHWCNGDPGRTAPTAFAGTVRSVVDQDEYYRQVTFDVTDWFTADRGAEIILSVQVGWSSTPYGDGAWPIDLHNEWLVATSYRATPSALSEMFVCASEPLTPDARQRWDERYSNG